MDGKMKDAKQRIKEINPVKASVSTAFLLAVVAVFFIGSSLGAFNAEGNAINSKKLTFEANGTALNTSGNETVNLGIATGENLNFGRIPVEASSTKFFNINAREKAFVSINAEGNISEALKYEKTHYFKGNKEISLRFDPGSVQHYEGNVTVNVNTADSEVGARWLDFKSKVY